ncbi:MAG: hypothetical protein U9P44_04025, partial [archaeon]|nr:hypothetical protein [archaeon]
RYPSKNKEQDKITISTNERYNPKTILLKKSDDGKTYTGETEEKRLKKILSTLGELQQATDKVIMPEETYKMPADDWTKMDVTVDIAKKTEKEGYGNKIKKFFGSIFHSKSSEPQSAEIEQEVQKMPGQEAQKIPGQEAQITEKTENAATYKSKQNVDEAATDNVKVDATGMDNLSLISEHKLDTGNGTESYVISRHPGKGTDTDKITVSTNKRYFPKMVLLKKSDDGRTYTGKADDENMKKMLESLDFSGHASKVSDDADKNRKDTLKEIAEVKYDKNIIDKATKSTIEETKTPADIREPRVAEKEAIHKTESSIFKEIEKNIQDIEKNMYAEKSIEKVTVSSDKIDTLPYVKKYELNEDKGADTKLNYVISRIPGKGKDADRIRVSTNDKHHPKTVLLRKTDDGKIYTGNTDDEKLKRVFCNLGEVTPINPNRLSEPQPTNVNEPQIPDGAKINETKSTIFKEIENKKADEVGTESSSKIGRLFKKIKSTLKV